MSHPESEIEACLRELLALGDLDESLATRVRFSGSDPVFRTPYRVGTAGAAALGALGLAVSDLWRRRKGTSQDVAVDLHAAAASLRSTRYLRIDGKEPASPWDPLSGFYPDRAGAWVNLHCNFPNHRNAAMRVLGAPPERAAVEAATRSWNGRALEDAIHAAGGCAGLARTAAQWAEHPQATAVAATPLIEIQRIGDAPAEALPPGPRPLSGVRVLDLTRVLAGPTCARTLAENGADVLKISAAHLPDSGPWEVDTGLGKLSAHVDLRSAAGVETLRGLLREADVFSQSYRPGTLAARGFDPERTAALRPGIVYVTLSAWGPTGPWCTRRGFDTIVQTVSGMALAQSGTPRPALMPVSAIDYVSGYLMAYGVMAALARRAREGGSWLVRASLARTGRWIVDRGVVANPLPVAEDLPDAEIERLTTEVDTSLGRIRHLRPVLALSETPPFWARPPARLGSHRPAWPNGADPRVL